MLVEVEDLRVSLRRERKKQIHILDGVSFSIDAGETLGVVGESGCLFLVTSLAINVSDPLLALGDAE